ncbi:MAG TPA: hypothetical protein VMX13_16060 [Sedimentisphaerales bacterium]|nr:hypothetical protein [Sedimentisphaerales bacterium]
MSQEELDAEEVVQKIEYNERLIHDVQCRLRLFDPETNVVYRDSEWGYQNGKEFVSGTRYGKTEDGEILPYTGINAFDGKVVRSYDYVPFSGDSRGGIYGYDPHVFSVPLSPKTMLGYTLEQDGIYTLSELLSDKYVKTKKARLDKFQDNECVILEATGFRAADDKLMYDLRIWIDPKRNYRPLKIEKYESPDEKNCIAGLRGERWTYLTTKIDDIQLEQADGIWFPICGKQTVYTINTELSLKGKTEQEIKNEYPGMSLEEIVKTINLVSVPFDPPHRAEFTDIRINKGIDPAKFTIVFPNGCKLWDDIAGIGYVVGDPEKIISKQLENLNADKVVQSVEQEGTKQSLEPILSPKTNPRQADPVKEVAQETVNKPNKLGALMLIAFLILLILLLIIFLVVKK